MASMEDFGFDQLRRQPGTLGHSFQLLVDRVRSTGREGAPGRRCPGLAVVIWCSARIRLALQAFYGHFDGKWSPGPAYTHFRPSSSLASAVILFFVSKLHTVNTGTTLPRSSQAA
jgi:hypothetical protein